MYLPFLAEEILILFSSNGRTLGGCENIINLRSGEKAGWKVKAGAGAL